MAERSVSTNYTNYPFVLAGNYDAKQSETIAQNVSRSGALAFGTIMAKDNTGDWVPLTDVDPALTSAYLTCGALAGNLTAWQGVSDGEFAVSVDGEDLELTGLDFSSISALTEIPSIINTAAAGKFIVEDVDGVAGSFRLKSLKQGLPQSSISVLSAVSGGSGTDISAGTVGLNGATGTGTISAASGDVSSSIPAGVYIGDAVTEAAIQAGDVSYALMLVLGHGLVLDKSQVVLENSLAWADVVSAKSKSIEDVLLELGISFAPSVAGSELD